MRFKIPKRQPASFKASALYLAGHTRGHTPDRVAWMEARNLNTTDPNTAAAIMEATAAQNVRCKQHSYHFVLAFDPKDKKRGKVPDEVMKEIASEAIERLGLSEHQALIYAHKDTDHPHIHFLVNRIHSKTGKAYDRHGDGLRLMGLCKDIAKERGLNILNDRSRIAEREHVDDFDDISPPSEGEYWQAKREDRKAQSPFTKEQLKKLREDTKTHFYNAASWEDLTARLGAQGIFLEPKGQGLIVTKGEAYAKLSQMGKQIRLDSLEKKFKESFADYMASRTTELSEKHFEETRPEGWEELSPAQQRRAERLREAQLAVERKKSDRIHELEEAELDYHYWQGIEINYRYGERRIRLLEREKSWLEKQRTNQDQWEYLAKQDMKEYTKQVFRKPERALKRWLALEAKHGIDNAASMIKANPHLLGGFKGSFVLGKETKERKKAKNSLRFLIMKRRKWRDKQAAVGHRIQKLQENHRQLKIALKDFEHVKQHVGDVKILEKIVLSKIKRRAKALDRCHEQLIRESRLEEHRKKHFIQARRAHLAKEREKERNRSV